MLAGCKDTPTDEPLRTPTDTQPSQVSTGEPEKLPDVVPAAELGNTGVKVTRLAIGASYPSYQPGLLQHAYNRGIRYFDNAYGYGNGGDERTLGKWLQRSGARDEVFIVTKAGLASPDAFYEKVTRALENLQVDTIDLMFIHNLGDPDVVLDRDNQWRQLKDRLVRENKIRFMGFSTHAEMDQRVQCIASAARSTWVDALMVACDPLMLRSRDDLNRALDTAHQAKIGLVAMKTTRGLGQAAARRRGVSEGMARTESMPGFEDQGISAFAAVHRGMWSDGRFAGVCSAMIDREKIDENTDNAKRFSKPFDDEHWQWLEDGLRSLARTTCPGCDGSCRKAAGSSTDFCSITRYLAYAEEDGDQDRARQLYASLSEAQRNWSDADLAAASAACKATLDFTALLPRAETFLA